MLSGAWAPPRGWVSWVSASRQATRTFRPQAFGLEQLLEQSGRLFATKVKADAATATPGNSSNSFNEKRSAAQRSAVSLQRLLWQQLVGAHGSQQRARQQIVDLLFTAQTHAPSSARAEVVAELLGVTADAKTGEFSSCYLEHVVSFGASVIGKLYGPDVASTFADNQATPIPERAGAPNPSLHAVLHSTPPLLPSSVAAYVSTHCRTAALPVGAPNGGALYDADRLMLVCLKGYRAYIEHEQAPFLDAFREADEHENGLLPLDRFVSLIQLLDPRREDAECEEMYYEAIATSDELSDHDGIDAEGFVATCFAHRMTAESLKVGSHARKRSIIERTRETLEKSAAVTALK